MCLYVFQRCTLIAIGNGTACRDAEKFITTLIKKGAFAPVEASYW